MLPQILFVATGMLTSVAVFLLGLTAPSFVREDGPVEMAGAAFFATSSIAALYWLLSRPSGLSRSDRRLLAGIAPVAALLALSEISFGARWGFVSPPALYGGGEFDGGHDIVILTLRLVRDDQSIALVVITTATLGAAFTAHLVWRRRERLIEKVSPYASQLGSRLAFVLLVLAAAVTLDLIESYKAAILEETLEFIAAALLLWATVSPGNGDMMVHRMEKTEIRS